MKQGKKPTSSQKNKGELHLVNRDGRPQVIAV